MTIIKPLKFTRATEVDSLPNYQGSNACDTPLVNCFWGWSDSGRTKLESGDFSKLLQEEFGNRLKFNELTFEPELYEEPIPGQIIERLSTHLSERGYKIHKEAASDGLIVAAQKHSFHPVSEYLIKIENDPSVVPIELDQVSSNYLGTNNPLYDLMLKTALVAAVARNLRRGIKFDSCLVLKGKQGIGKSSFFKILAGEDWFCDTWQDKPQDLYMAIQRCWLYELAELDYMTSKQEVGKMKALISSATDTFRVPYGKTNQPYKRPSIFVGTVNRSDFLNDPDGSRRFWVIDLPNQRLNLIRVREHRDKIWKAALIAYRKGFRLFLPPKEQLLSNQNNVLFEAEHPFFATLSAWLVDPLNSDTVEDGFSTEDALISSGCRCQGQIRGNDSKEAANCLRQLGFEKDKHQRYKDGIKQPRKWRRSN